VVEPALDFEDEKEYTVFVYALVNKPEQLTWLKENYETLETDSVCPKSLT